MKKNKFIFLYLLICICFGYFMLTGYFDKRDVLKKYRENLLSFNKLKGEQFRKQHGIGGAESLYRPSYKKRSDKEPTLYPMPESKKASVTSPKGIREGIFVDGLTDHKGIDLSGVYRSEILSSGDGVVIEVWPAPDGYFRGHPIYGGLIVVKHPSGHITKYAHLSKTFVKEWDRVSCGQVIGRMGNTGKSDGAHLHYEIISPEGEQLNPLDMISGINVDHTGRIIFR